MFVLPDVDRLKSKFSNKYKNGRNSTICQKNYNKELKSMNKTSYYIPNSPIKRQINNTSQEESKNKHSNKNSTSIFDSVKRTTILNKNIKNLKYQIKTFKYSTEIKKFEKENMLDSIEYNDKSNNQKSFLNVKSNYNNLTNKFFNRQIDINQFLKEINLFLLQNNKIFEIIQNIINHKIIMNNNYSNIYALTLLFKNKEIPVHNFNYGLIFKSIIKNTFNESLKKAFLNKSLISKKEIKEEYQKQINNIKKYLNIYNKEKKDLTCNKKCDTLIINNNSHHQYNNKISSIKNNKKMNLIRNRRKKLIIQRNSSNNNFFSSDNYNKEFFYTKYHNIKMKPKEMDKKDSLESSQDNNTPDKEKNEKHFDSVIIKRKIDILRKKRLNDIIKKQKRIIDNYIKLKEKNNNNKSNIIKTEKSFEEKFKIFTKLIKSKKDNKNEDIINCINLSDKSFKFENSLTKENITNHFFQENKINENECNINPLKNFEKETLFINKIYLENENESKNKDYSNNNIYFLKNSISHKLYFCKKLNNDSKDNNQSNAKLIKENYYHLSDIDIKSKKKEGEIINYENNKKNIILNQKKYFKKNKNFDISNLKDFINK